MAPYLRPFLAVSDTTLRNAKGKRLPCKGLFSTHPLKRGSLLGFYNGTFTDAYPDAGSILCDYVFMLSDETYIVPEATIDARGKEMVDPAAYPLAMCNEPQGDRYPNVQTYELSRARRYILNMRGSAPVAALLFFTCRDVEAGEELFVSYGNEFRRDYPAPGRQRPEKPLRVAEHETVADLVRIYGACCSHVDSECFVEYE